MKHTVNPGDIIIYNNLGKSLYSKLQNIFTRMKMTHVGLGFFPINKRDTVFESVNAQSVTPWDRSIEAQHIIEYWAFEWIDVPQDVLEKILYDTYEKFAGKTYGFTQIIYFARRYIWETKWIAKYLGWLPKVFGKDIKDVKRWNNWFISGTICSELGHRFAKAVAIIAAIDPRVKDQDRFIALRKYLNEWNANNFHVGDMNNVLLKFPDIFKLKFANEINKY